MGVPSVSHHRHSPKEVCITLNTPTFFQRLLLKPRLHQEWWHTLVSRMSISVDFGPERSVRDQGCASAALRQTLFDKSDKPSTSTA